MPTRPPAARRWRRWWIDFFLLPLWEKVARIARCETDEGYVSTERTPHPPSLCSGTFSHKGRREDLLARLSLSQSVGNAPALPQSNSRSPRACGTPNALTA